MYQSNTTCGSLGDSDSNKLTVNSHLRDSLENESRLNTDITEFLKIFIGMMTVLRFCKTKKANLPFRGKKEHIKIN